MVHIEKSTFGRLEHGEVIELYCLKNGFLTVEISTLGASVVSLNVPDRRNRQTDVVLGLCTPKDYWDPSFTSMGKTIGRYANRIRNAEFCLNGEYYRLSPNFIEKHHIHGGECGFEQKIWKADVVESGVIMGYVSADGEEGYPGELYTTVSFLLEEQSLRIRFEAYSDRDTIVNLGSQLYFNLDGHDSGTIENQQLKICADWITETDEEYLPTGVMLPVRQTSLDFCSYKLIGCAACSEDTQIKKVEGLDHNYVIREYDGTLRKNLEMKGQKSGIHMSLFSDLPGIQVYSGNNLDGSLNGKAGIRYKKREGICFVPQYFPDSIHLKHVPSPILKMGERYLHETIYLFDHHA